MTLINEDGLGVWEKHNGHGGIVLGL